MFFLSILYLPNGILFKFVFKCCSWISVSIPITIAMSIAIVLVSVVGFLLVYVTIETSVFFFFFVAYFCNFNSHLKLRKCSK